MQTYQLYLTGCGLDDFELILTELDDFVQLWETLIFVQNQATHSHIFITLGKIKIKEFVHLVYLQACRQQIIAVLGLFGNLLG